MKPSLIAQVSCRFIVPLLNALSLWILLRGHNMPGGGFVGGLVLASSMAFILFTYGEKQMFKFLILKPLSWIALGLLVALGSAFWALLRGEPFFTAYWPTGLAQGLGTPVIFDLGVYWVVLGVFTQIFWALMKPDDSEETL